MYVVPRDKFEELVNEAIAKLPEIYRDKLQNVAFIVEEDPSDLQRVNLKLADNQTLFGLYEGVPLSQRQGSLKILPDKISLFQNPIQSSVSNSRDLYDRIARTVWHEVAHYFGLDHHQIDELNKKEFKKD